MFAVGAELCRRGYDVALTVGNAPTKDLMCESPGRRNFKVQVKSTSTKNFVLVQKRVLDLPTDDALVFVVVLVPPDSSERIQFFVLTHAEVQAAHRALSVRKRLGEPLKPGFEGMNWGQAAAHEGRWDKLPG
jgi:hypothetical protein